MPSTHTTDHALLKRLMPLYGLSFFQGLIFWYAVEKVFMTSIGFSPVMITASVVLMTVTSFIVEVPSGILADRWSRKGMLIVSMTALSCAALILGLSKDVPMYLVGVIFAAIYGATYSGLIDSIVYDTMLEQEGSGRHFNRYFGRSKLYTSIAWVVGSLLGAVIAQRYGLRMAFLYSVPSCLFALLSAFVVHEPKLHKAQDENTKLLLHIKQTFRYVFRKGTSGWLIVCIIASAVPMIFLMEVDQLWPLALMLPLLWYGPLNAFLLSGPGLGGILADKVTSTRVYIALSCVSLVSVGMLSVHNIIATATGQFGAIVAFTAMNIIVSGKLHDSIPSRVRTGVSSAVSTLTSLVAMPLLLIFGYLAERYSVFRASLLLLVISVIAVTAFLKIMSSERLHN